MASRDAATFQVYRPMAMPTPAALPPSSQQITMPFTAAPVDAVLPAPRKAAATQGGKDRHSKAEPSILAATGSGTTPAVFSCSSAPSTASSSFLLGKRPRQEDHEAPTFWEALQQQPRPAVSSWGALVSPSQEAQAYASSVAQVHHLNLLSALSGAATRRPAQEESR
uniref:Uncharacterized protein n=1 Tax=Oryza rufipogon TaxID=4529 RepID=A0A0E0PBS2_ORYRU